MPANLELDPLFDMSLKARIRRVLRKILNSHYLLIAVMIHVLILIIFGGKVLFEAFQQVNLESDSIIAPHQGTSSPPPPSGSEVKTFDVKVAIPQNSKLTNKLAIDKLSPEFNVAAPEIQSSVSVSMEGIGSVGGSGSGNGTGSGFASINFFGISGNASKIIFLVDISTSMTNGIKIGHPYEEIINEVSKGLAGLNEQLEFNIIAFARKNFSYKPALVRATSSEKQNAIEWFKKLNPMFVLELRKAGKPDVLEGVMDAHLGTRADLALEQALQMKPATIMFISDGTPVVKGGPDVLIENVKKWQTQFGSKTVINTVFYKTSNSENSTECKDFMTKLAKGNSGKFRSIE